MICCRTLVPVPVPGAAGVRMKGIEPRVFVKDSSGSVLLKGMFAVSPPASSRRPKVWSMNWPQTKPHWVTLFSENRFWLESL